MSAAADSIVVGLGEALWDCFADSRRPGGAPANVAFGAFQLGYRGIVCSRVGADALGDELLAYLTDQGLDTRFIQRDADHATGTVTVNAAIADAPDYVIHEDVAWDHLAFDADTESLMRRADAVCFGTLAQRSDTARETIHRCLGAVGPECLTVYDVNLRQQWYDRDRIERSMKAAKIVKLNADEMRTLTPILDIERSDAESFGRELRERYGVAITCVTRGERGCLLVDRNETIDLPGVPVTVADAVGAGDAFTSGLIATRLEGWSLRAGGEFANRVGALVASRPGARPPLRADLARLRDAFRD